jgi:hypothetical protein
MKVDNNLVLHFINFIKWRVKMKKFFLFVMFLIVITVLLSLITKIQEETAFEEYASWELQCMEEYEQSKDYFIFIDVPQHTLDLYKQNKKIKQYKIATGATGTPSPIGVWSIVSKSSWGKGFGGQWLGLNVPWGTYGIHGTLKPNSIGHNASHGCIRMYSEDVKELAQIIKHGTKVEIYGGEFGPFGSKFRTLIPGDRGSDVMEVQKILKKLGYFKGSLDGIYGAAMETAIVKFEKDHKQKPDKVVDAKLYKLLGITYFN